MKIKNTSHTALKAVLVMFALALVASACGGGGGDSADAELITAITEAMEEDGATDGLDLDSGCMATGIVEELGGAETIEAEYGLTAESVRDGEDIDDIELDEGTARDLTDAIFDCSDMAGLIASSFADEGIDGAAQECLADLIPEDALRTMMAAGFMGDNGADLEAEATDALFGALFSGATECGLG